MCLFCTSHVLCVVRARLHVADQGLCNKCFYESKIVSLISRNQIKFYHKKYITLLHRHTQLDDFVSARMQARRFLKYRRVQMFGIFAHYDIT